MLIGPRLHYTELARRSLCVWRYFYIREHRLEHVVALWLNGYRSFSVWCRPFVNVVVPTVRPRFVVYAHVFLRMPTNCPYANGSFIVRNANFFLRQQYVNGSTRNEIRTVCLSAVWPGFVASIALFVQPNCGSVYISLSPNLLELNFYLNVEQIGREILPNSWPKNLEVISFHIHENKSGRKILPNE